MKNSLRLQQFVPVGRKNRSAWRRRLLFVVLIGLLSSFGSPQSVEAQYDNQYVIKAALIMKFTKYISWKEPYASDTEFIIGVLGDDSEIIPYLVEAAEYKKVKSRIIVIDKFGPSTIPMANTIRYCDIFFLPRKHANLTERVIDLIEDSNTLLVGESKNFAKKGGTINFIHVDNHINFEINKQAVQRANFQIDPQLLNLAVLVDEGQ